MRVETAPFGTGEVAWRFPIEVADVPAIALTAAGFGLKFGAGVYATGQLITGAAIVVLTVKGLKAGGKVVADWVKKDPERAGKAAEEGV